MSSEQLLTRTGNRFPDDGGARLGGGRGKSPSELALPRHLLVLLQGLRLCCLIPGFGWKRPGLCIQDRIIRKDIREFLLWHNRISSISAAPGYGFDPSAWHSGVKDQALPQLQLGSDSGPGNFHMQWGGQKKKEKKKQPPVNGFILLSTYYVPGTMSFTVPSYLVPTVTLCGVILLMRGLKLTCPGPHN